MHSFDIMPGLYSIIKSTLGNNDIVRGNAFVEIHYINQIKNIINICQNEFSTLEDRGPARVMTKMKSRLHYCVKMKM